MATPSFSAAAIADDALSLSTISALLERSLM
jgi:hypothetical protein